MHLFLAFAALAAGTASPVLASADVAQCEVPASREVLLKKTLGRSELLTRLANAGLAQEREIAAATARSRSSDRAAAAQALRLLSDPEFTAAQASMDARIDTLFDRVVAALQSADEVKRCQTVVTTLDAVVALEAESERRAQSVARMFDNNRLADAR